LGLADNELDGVGDRAASRGERQGVSACREIDGGDRVRPGAVRGTALAVPQTQPVAAGTARSVTDAAGAHRAAAAAAPPQPIGMQQLPGL